MRLLNNNDSINKHDEGENKTLWWERHKLGTILQKKCTLSHQTLKIAMGALDLVK